MNYIKIYNNIIFKRQITEINTYGEIHHIIPKSLGGTDDKLNLVKLSAREHFICHLLLTKMYPEGSIEWIKMLNAFNLMLFSKNSYQERYINSHFYSYWREKFSKAQKLNQTGINNSQFGTVWISNSNLNKSIKIQRSNIQEWLNNGWFIGRVIKWSKFKAKEQERLENKKRKELKFLEYKNLYTKYYEIYDTYGWEEFCKITNWKYSKPCLVGKFTKFVDHFKPQNGKKRGKHSQIL